jgi:4'-phosphopantetheinyl transferase
MTVDRAGTIRAVDVWVAPLAVPEPQHARLIASLSEAERRRADCYRFADGSRRFALGRAWLRHVLGAELGVPPAAVDLPDRPGKPRMATSTGPCFSLARSADLAVVAVAPFEVGVDVERLDQTVDGAAAVACTGREAADLRRLPAGARIEAFLGLWTAKEAYLKATGAGLAVAPASVEVGVGTGAVAPVGGPGGARWWVREFRPRAGFVGAVAAEGPGFSIRLRDVVDLRS